MNLKYILVAGIILVGGLLPGCKNDSPTKAPEQKDKSPDIVSAKIIYPGKKIPGLGDLWLSTWASDDNIYMSWGDGIGPGIFYPIPDGVPNPDSALVISSCENDPIIFCKDFCGVFNCDGVTPYAPKVLTQAGLLKFSGSINSFTGCDDGSCVQSIHIPSGIPQFKFNTNPTQRRGDKPSGLLALGGKLYWFGHQLMTNPKYGYVAVSDDMGKTWNEIPSSPWTDKSNFRIMMVINMGQGYNLNADGFVYFLGINGELNWPPVSQKVYLAKVETGKILQYKSYKYFRGFNSNGQPLWSVSQDSAKALQNLTTIAMGSAIFHHGLGKYLFLAVPNYAEGPALTLFYSDYPWGPWRKAQKFDGEVYIAGIISKDTSPNSFYFTAAGGGGIGNTYQLTIAKMEVTTNN